MSSFCIIYIGKFTPVCNEVMVCTEHRVVSAYYNRRSGKYSNIAVSFTAGGGGVVPYVGYKGLLYLPTQICFLMGEERVKCHGSKLTNSLG